MRRYVVIAGPQASGKSTLKEHMAKKYPNTPLMAEAVSQSRPIILLEESRQIVVHKYQLKGAIFMDYTHELEVINHDMGRMFHIMKREDKGELYIDECNVFTLGHAKAHGIDLLDGFFKQYCDMLMRLDARVLFLDTPPDISWERREPRYSERLWNMPSDEREQIMRRYRDYLDRLYPELVELYDMLEMPKARIDSSAPLEEALEKGEHSLIGLLEQSA